MNQAISDLVSIDAPDIAPQKIQPQELQEFVAALVSGVVHQPKSLWDSLRFSMRNVVASMVLRYSHSPDKLAVAARIGSHIHPLRSYAERLAQKELQLRDTIAHGLVMVARVDGKAAALVGMHIAMTLPDGRKMYESTSITLPAYQHQGLNSMLREPFVQYIESIDAKPVFVVRSKNQNVISRCRSEGWKEVPYAEMTQRFGIPMSPNEISYMDRDGWFAYEFDPATKGPLSASLQEIHDERHHKHPVISLRPAIAFATAALGVLALMISMFDTSTWYATRFGTNVSQNILDNLETVTLFVGIGLILAAVIIGVTGRKRSL